MSMLMPKPARPGAQTASNLTSAVLPTILPSPLFEISRDQIKGAVEAHLAQTVSPGSEKGKDVSSQVTREILSHLQNGEFREALRLVEPPKRAAALARNTAFLAEFIEVSARTLARESLKGGLEAASALEPLLRDLRFSDELKDEVYKHAIRISLSEGGDNVMHTVNRLHSHRPEDLRVPVHPELRMLAAARVTETLRQGGTGEYLQFISSPYSPGHNMLPASLRESAREGVARILSMVDIHTADDSIAKNVLDSVSTLAALGRVEPVEMWNTAVPVVHALSSVGRHHLADRAVDLFLPLSVLLPTSGFSMEGAKDAILHSLNSLAEKGRGCAQAVARAVGHIVAQSEASAHALHAVSAHDLNSHTPVVNRGLLESLVKYVSHLEVEVPHFKNEMVLPLDSIDRAEKELCFRGIPCVPFSSERLAVQILPSQVTAIGRLAHHLITESPAITLTAKAFNRSGDIGVLGSYAAKSHTINLDLSLLRSVYSPSLSLNMLHTHEKNHALSRAEVNNLNPAVIHGALRVHNPPRGLIPYGEGFGFDELTSYRVELELASSLQDAHGDALPLSAPLTKLRQAQTRWAHSGLDIAGRTLEAVTAMKQGLQSGTLKVEFYEHRDYPGLITATTTVQTKRDGMIDVWLPLPASGGKGDVLNRTYLSAALRGLEEAAIFHKAFFKLEIDRVEGA